MPVIVRFVSWLLDLLGIGPRITHRITGHVAGRTSAAVGGLCVVMVDKDVGGCTELARMETDARGRYGLAFSDVEIRRGGKGRRRAAWSATDDGSIRPEGRNCK